MEKTTVLRDVKITTSGVEANFELIDDAGKRLHIIVCDTGSDMDERLESVNRSIAEDLGFPAVSEGQWNPVREAVNQP